MDSAVESDTRVGLFTRGAEVAYDLLYNIPTNVAIHNYWDSERLIVFGKTLKRYRIRGRNEVA